MQREQILQEAIRLMMVERDDDYGPPSENMEAIAKAFNAVTGQDLTGWDVAILNVVQKLRRMKTSPGKGDHYVDGAAYLAIAAECTGPSDDPE